MQKRNAVIKFKWNTFVRFNLTATNKITRAVSGYWKKLSTILQKVG